MRLNRHLERIDEVVKKTEVEEALRNANILVGAEFEFIHKDLKKVFENAHDDFEDALNDWNNHMQDLEDWRDRSAELAQDIKDLRKEWRNASQGEKDDIQDQIEMLEEDAEELHNNPPDIRNGDYDHFEDYINSYVMDYDWPQAGEDIDEPDDPTESDILNDFWLQEAKKIKWSGAPFSNPVIDFYGQAPEQKPGETYWVAEADQSIGLAGIEVKSPPLPLPDFIKAMDKMFQYIKKNGTTTTDTGFHVHMSIKGVNDLSRVLDPIKLILFTDEDYIFKNMKDRANNSYVLSVKDKLKGQGNLEPRDLKDMLDTGKVKSKFAAEHNDAINFTHWKKGHVEFRHMGGSKYHTKGNVIRAIVANFAHNIGLAVDKNYKKREYILKLERIFNKIQLFELEETLNWIDYARTESLNKRDKDIMNALKIVERKVRYNLNTLRKVYKLDNKTITLIKNNKKFMMPMNQRIKKMLRDEVRALTNKKELKGVDK